MRGSAGGENLILCREADMGERNLLEISALSFEYGGHGEFKHRVLEDINIVMKEGECVGLIGANGVGKSTLLKLLAGLLDLQEGRVRIDGLDMKKENLRQIRAELGYVFQDSDSQLFMSTAYEDVAFAPRNYGLSEKEIEERVTTALKQVGALALREKQIYRMSGGEKKLISIATVLSMMPDIIIMDEPSAALDPRNRRNLIRLLNSMDAARIIASHDLDFIMDTCSRVILIDHGLVIADGETQEILQNQTLLEAHGLELPLSLYRSGTNHA